MAQPMIEERTLVLIDPSSPHGECGLQALTADDRAVSLMLSLDGRSARSLRQFAESERIDVSMAGLIYLDRVVSRMGTHTDDIETISTSGRDPVGAIFDVLEQRRVNRVIVPEGLAGLEGEGLATLIRLCPVPVVVTPGSEGGGTGFPMAS